MKPLTKFTAAFAATCLLLLQCSNTPGIAGVTDMPNETASVAAVIHDQDGTRLSRAEVTMVPAEYLAPLPQSAEKVTHTIITTMTDDSGRFVVDSIDSGNYMIEVNNGVSSACRIHCSVDNDTGTNNLGAFTVLPYTAISGKIDTTVMPVTQRYVQIFGLNRIVPIENDGSFTFNGLPADLITLRIVSIDTAVKPFEISDIQLNPGETKKLYAPWLSSKKIHINTTLSGADVSEDVYGFPILIRLNATNFNFSSAQNDGSDIRFTKPDNTMLPYEIERWNAASQLAELWVKVDTIFGNDSTQAIIMNWGNPDAANKSSSPAVFDTANGFQGVWHLGESGNTIAKDATGNHYDGTPSDTVPLGAEGTIGPCRSFNGSSNYLRMNGTADSKLNFPENGIYTISAWAYVDTLDNGSRLIAGKGNEQYFLKFKPSAPAGSSMVWEFVEYHDNDGWYITNSLPGIPLSKSWTHIVGVRAGNTQFFYVNGELVDSAIAVTAANAPRSTEADVSIGKFLSMPSDTIEGMSSFRGKIDEVRIANVAPSANWIKLCYMNQKEQDALVTW